MDDIGIFLSIAVGIQALVIAPLATLVAFIYKSRNANVDKEFDKLDLAISRLEDVLKARLLRAEETINKNNKFTHEEIEKTWNFISERRTELIDAQQRDQEIFSKLGERIAWCEAVLGNDEAGMRGQLSHFTKFMTEKVIDAQNR